MNDHIENIARAFYAAEEEAQFWEREPEILKEEFRRHARTALALLEQQSGEELLELGAFALCRAA
jgi:hypothetical protein